MPRYHHEASLAHGAVNHARGVLDNIRSDDLLMAQGHAALLLQCTQELLRWLNEQVRDLPEPEWHRRLYNPYENIYLSGPTTEDGLRRLSDERLLEYCRGTNWSRENTTDGMSRWWLSKAMSRAKRELRARGLDPESWRDGTEAE